MNFTCIVICIYLAIYLISVYDSKFFKKNIDYSYGLTLEGVLIAINTLDDENFLALAVQIRNYSPNPLRYEISEFDFRISNRALPRYEVGRLRGYLPRGGGKTSSSLPFKKDDLKIVFDGQLHKGTLDVEIEYGHPAESPVRKLKVKCDITLKQYSANPASIDTTGQVRVGDIFISNDIISEEDMPI